MSVSLVLGLMASSATPTCSDEGAVQLTEGAARSALKLRCASLDPTPAFSAVTLTGMCASM